jgi:hypothetical protein
MLRESGNTSLSCSKSVTSLKRGISRITLIGVLAVLLLSSCGYSERYENVRETVYIMDTGIRYHLESCRFVTPQAEKVLLGYAVGEHFSPCPVCKPPRLIETEADPARDFRRVLIGSATFAFFVFGAPFIIRRLIYRRRALHIAKCRFGDKWRGKSRTERKQIIAEGITSFKNPPPSRPSADRERIRY